jgi:helicase required for RNAi-mediated heterochromatin assembly 1
MLTDDGFATRISFTLNPPEELDWSASKRLRPGALVLLSPAADNFKSKTLLAVVAYRFLCGGLEPNLDAGEAADTPPRIDLFCEWDADFLNSSSNYVMLESKSGYFESVRYAMKGLQQSIFERHESLLCHPLLSILTHTQVKSR